MTRTETIAMDVGDQIVHTKQYGSIKRVETLMEVREVEPHGAILLDKSVHHQRFASNEELRTDYRVATPEDIEAAKPKPAPQQIDRAEIKRQRLAKVGR